MELFTLVFPDPTKYWNNIGFDGIDYISLFKKKLFSLIRPEKKSFLGIHNPVGIKNIMYIVNCIVI